MAVEAKFLRSSAARLRDQQKLGEQGHLPLKPETRHSHPELWGCRAGSAGVGGAEAAPRDRHRGTGQVLTVPWTNLGSGQTGAGGARPGPGRGALRGPASAARPARTRLMLHTSQGRWSTGRALGPAGGPQHHPHPRGSLIHSPVQGPSVLGFHTIAVTWEILEDPAGPHFSCTPQDRSPRPAPSFRGHHLRPHRTPCCCAWPVPGSRDGPGSLSCGAPAWRENSYTPASPLTSFSSQVWTDASPGSPSHCRQSCPTRGAGLEMLGSVAVSPRRSLSHPTPGSAPWPVSPAVPTWAE